MNVEVVVLIEGDFIAVENVQSAADGPEISCEDVALFVDLVAMGNCRDA